MRLIDFVTVVVPAIVGSGGLTLWVSRRQRNAETLRTNEETRRTRAETDSEVVQAADLMLTQLRRTVTDQSHDIEVQAKRLTAQASQIQEIQRRLDTVEDRERHNLSRISALSTYAAAAYALARERQPDFAPPPVLD